MLPDNFYPPNEDFRRAVEEVVFDAVWKDYFYFSTLFESADGYEILGAGAAGSGVSVDGLVLNTGAVLNNSASFDKTPSPTGPGQTMNILSFKQRQRFRANFAVDSITKITAYITRGVQYGADYPYYGFKIVDNKLKGVSKDTDAGGEAAIDLMTIAVNTTYIVEARLLPGEKVLFYVVNNTTKKLEEIGILTTKIPSLSNTNNKTFFEYFVSTQDSDNKMLTSSFFEYIQKRDRY